MKRTFTKKPVMANANKPTDNVRTYRNNRNPNKYIEVKKADDGHSYARQYLKWDTPRGEVKNYMGARTSRGRYFRHDKQSIEQMLEDYTEVTSADNSGDIQYSQVSFDFSYDGDYDATKVQNAVETAISQVVAEVLGVGFESVDYSGYPEYEGVSVSQCNADFSYFGDYDAKRIEDSISAELADCGCELVGIDFQSMNGQYK